MEKSVSVFGFEGYNVRIIDQDGEPWFVAKDVCEFFGDSDHKRSVARIDELDKGIADITDRLGRNQAAVIINESGLYSLLFGFQPEKSRKDGGAHIEPHIKSRIEKLRKFKRWVTHEVLPSIRKTGKYEVPESMRARSKRVRVEFTDTLKEHGLKTPIEYMKITTTMKSHAGINGKKKKDDMDALELARIEASEMLARISLMTQDAQGYEECKPLCQNAADTVSKFIESKKPGVIE